MPFIHNNARWVAWCSLIFLLYFSFVDLAHISNDMRIFLSWFSKFKIKSNKTRYSHLLKFSRIQKSIFRKRIIPNKKSTNENTFMNSCQSGNHDRKAYSLFSLLRWFDSGLTLNQYGVSSPCRTICSVCGFVALSWFKFNPLEIPIKKVVWKQKIRFQTTF